MIYYFGNVLTLGSERSRFYSTPVVTPWVGLTFGWPWAMTLGAVVIFVGAFVWIWILPPDEATSPTLEPVSTSVPEA